MKRFSRVLAATVLAGLPFLVQAQVPDPAAEALARLSRTITLADLPDVAECRGVHLPPEAIDRVNGASEDPHETFERWRMERRSMVEESPGIAKPLEKTFPAKEAASGGASVGGGGCGCN